MYFEGSYNYSIVILSIAIAILASYSALSISAKVAHTRGKNRLFWLLAGSLTMGGGIWSMHFVGMLAFHMPMTIKYDGVLTALSMLASFLSSFIAFYITKEPKNNRLKMAIGGFIMGSGIVTMHYMGMEAMIMPLEMTYDRSLWILSAIIALVASYSALFLFLRFRNQSSASWLKWLSAITMGFAIGGMHYTGMKATKFHSHHEIATNSSSSVNLFLLYGVTITIVLILLISWAAVFFDRTVLEKMAYRDNITGLPNRNEMNRFFDTYVGNKRFAVLFIDLDQFKVINDTLGHNIGDILLKEVGRRLRKFLRNGQQVYRIGGDEFLLIVEDGDQKQAENLATDILKSIKEVYRIEGNELYITGSIGISIGSIKETDRAMLLKTADTAMYTAKSSGKNQYEMYNEQTGNTEIRKMELQKDMQWAMDAGQFYVVYQPKWNVQTNSLVGFEALLRWNHPRLGVVSPGEFIPIAEETGLIVPLTKWTLDEACRQCKKWESQGCVNPISVNISIRLFQTDTLIDFVKDVLEKTDLEPQLLELEITESIVFLDIDDIIRQLNAIRSLGVRVSMDDFGTGYSSIGLLDRIPIDSLKLDRLFTNDLETSSKRAIINAILVMASELNLDVIAEGVESQEQIESLTELGCNIMQGYYYSKPMKVEEIDPWIKSRVLQ
ncbi:EAL domain-containing protein [Bacillaceae bacterium CLA-AA-H227]|uniref:EAL domain-containing protein n=1 Tax=Robertmurraya yapensis (ex Hitch et al 2024) TaxID=3133160 RepID=A0ACC6S9Y7_9BACI